MASPSKVQPESHDNGGGKEPSPMDKFRKLTKDLSRVDPEEVREAERREREERRKPS